MKQYNIFGELVSPITEKTMSLNYQIKKEKRLEEIEKIEQQIKQENLQSTNKLYEVVVIDPPWDYSEVGGKTSKQYDPQIARDVVPYPTMTLEQIKAINLPLKENATVFLWITPKFMPFFNEILNVWQLKYKNIMVWDKIKLGMGQFLRHQIEYIIIAEKGKPIYKPNYSQRDVLKEARREHSRKPECFYKMVEELCIGEKLDFFAREKRTGWEVYGAESNKF